MRSEKQCSVCGLKFEPAWTDAEAIAELRANQPFLNERLGTPPPDTPLACLCDDCYQEFMEWVAKRPVDRKRGVISEEERP